MLLGQLNVGSRNSGGQNAQDEDAIVKWQMELSKEFS